LSRRSGEAAKADIHENAALLSLLLPALLSRPALLSAQKLTAAFRRSAGF
jgi:hypothetical protein